MSTTVTPMTLDDAERTPCEVWTRVMGYHRPLSCWNAGKRAEHAERRYFSETGTNPDHAHTRCRTGMLQRAA